MYRGDGRRSYPRNVRCLLDEDRIVLRSDYQSLLAGIDRRKHGDDLFGLVFVKRDIVDNDQLTVIDLGAERALERYPLDLLVYADLVEPRLRSAGETAVCPLS